MRKKNFIKKLIHHPHFIAWILFIFFTTVYFSSTVGIMNSSDSPQYALTQSIIEEHSIKINNFNKWVWPDFAVYEENQYSVRTLGESLAMIPFYILGKILLPFANFPYKNPLHQGIIEESKLESLTVLTDATFGALLLILIFLFCLKLTKSIPASLLTVFTMGLGTLWWRYSSQIQRYPIAMFFYFLTFYVYYSSLNTKKTLTKIKIFTLGLMLGITLIIDLSLLLITLFFLFVITLRILKIEFSFSKLTLLYISLILPLILLAYYNYKAFNNPLTSAYLYHGVKPYLRDKNIIFANPVFPSILVNLFNTGPVPQNAFAKRIWNNTEIREKESIIWATRYPYKGIFTQSPALYFTILGLLIAFKRNKLLIILIFSMVILLIIQNSKLLYFFAPNSYDTHYFLPAIPLLIIGLSVWIKNIFQIKNFLAKNIFIFITGLSICISIYNGWYANLTNYAPHVTGEHRFSFEQLQQPFFTSQNIKNNLWLLFINTFPNIYNIHLLFLFYFPLFFLIYLIVLKRNLFNKKLVSWLKHLIGI